MGHWITRMFRRGFYRQCAALLCVVLLDAAFLGTAMGVMRGPEAALPAGAPELSASGSVVALTFDDGPHREHTARLLDGLKERNAKATFFLMGQNIPGNEELVVRMRQDGHLIGNHSYRHIRLTKTGEEVVCDGGEKSDGIIQDITGERPQYLRPPYGDWNDNLECRMDLSTVFWSVDSLDWKLQNTQRIVRRVLDVVENGDVILMHDIFSESVEAALQIVDALQAEGYQFVTVDELMID